MYNYLILGLLQILFSFNSENVPPQEAGIGTATENTKNTEVTFFNDDLVFEDELYTILLRVDKQKNEDYQMSIEMHLKKNAYFVSPNERGNFTGKFTLVLSESEKIIANGAISESPLSKVDYANGSVKLVRENTSYKQMLEILAKDNFEINGFLRFTIEPRCTLEKIPFVISYTNGKLTLKKNGC
jgi:hypothetical protein